LAGDVDYIIYNSCVIDGEGLLPLAAGQGKGTWWGDAGAADGESPGGLRGVERAEEEEEAQGR
jgi:hypothetical protein